MAKGSKEEDLAIDFSQIGRKISGLFQSGKPQGSRKHSKRSGSKKAESGDEAGQGEEFAIDIRKAKDFIIKHKVLLLILIPLFLAVFFRAYPIYLPVTDDWAENSVQNYFKDQITQRVNQQYPNLPPENRKSIINENLQKVMDQEQEMYQQQVSQLSENFKSKFQTEDGQTYLLAIDPWQWYRYSGNIIDHGYPGDYINDSGVMIDDHMLAPIGNKVGDELHPYIGAYFYKFLHLFNSDISLMTAFFLLPLIIASLAVIPAFFIGRKLGGLLGGLFASILVAVHPSVLGRTAAGFADTDPYNILFPLLIFWLFFEALDAEDRKKTIIYSLLAGAATTIFSSIWYGWWYIFDFLVAAAVIYMIYLLITHKESLKDMINLRKDAKRTAGNTAFIALICFIAVTSILVGIFTGTSDLSSIYQQPINFLTIKESASSTLWPNVFTTVAELNEASFKQIINSLGGRMLFAISLLGIILTLTLRKEDKRDVKHAIILIIWFAGTIYASTKGIRFTLLLVPAFSIAIGAAAGIIYDRLSGWISRELNINRKLTNLVIIILLAMILIGPIKSAGATARKEVPSMNDAWYDSLTNIKEQSSEDAIINSWWDFGHWFKAVADRAVTFDGASQNKPQAHWIGRVLLTDDEDEAIGILRMLDCGANTAFDKLNKDTDSTMNSVQLLYDIIVLDREGAKERLEEEGIEKDIISKVLERTHCQPPEDYFITSEDMVGKAGVWGHFGSWSFEKAKIWRDLRKQDSDEAVEYMTSRFGYSESRAEDLYYETQSITSEKDANDWISPWPGYAGFTSCPRIQDRNNTIQCVFNMKQRKLPVQVDLGTMEAVIKTSKEDMHPASMSYTKDGEFFLKEYENGTIPYSVALVEQDNNHQAVLMSPELEASMFTRLFYHNGTGLDHFEKFDHRRDVQGQNIITWKIDWRGQTGP
ncbi:MAG: STT3 domain-containing protein [Candidatus Woesearchaeota archaeon]